MSKPAGSKRKTAVPVTSPVSPSWAGAENAPLFAGELEALGGLEDLVVHAAFDPLAEGVAFPVHFKECFEFGSACEDLHSLLVLGEALEEDQGEIARRGSNTAEPTGNGVVV